MANKQKDPITNLQIWTVPQLKNIDIDKANKNPDDLDLEDPTNIIRNADDDYMDYINREVQELNN